MKKIVFDKFINQYISEEWSLLLTKHVNIFKFKKGERIFNEGTKVIGIYFINCGKVKVTSYYDEENERILRLSGPGTFLGHRGMNTTYYPVSGVALTDCEVSFIPVDIFKKIIRSNPDFSIFLLNFVTDDLKNTEDRMKSMIHNDVIVRVGIIICMLIDSFGYDDEIPKKLQYTLSRSDIASLAGTSYESVVRNLAKLEDQKIIKLDNKSIIILKEKDLRKMIMIKSRF